MSDLRALACDTSAFPLIPAPSASADPSRMLVLDKSRALDEMLWLSQRAHNAVPVPYQLPAPPVAITTPDGSRRLATVLVLREPQEAGTAPLDSLLMTATPAPHP